MIVVDLTLSRRLERAEGASNARAVEARARLFPGEGSTWIEVAGALVMYAGVESPMTQTFGLGLFQAPTADDLAAIETFYAERRSPVFHEVSPIADPATLGLLTSRGYEPIEFTTVLYQSLAPAEPEIAIARQTRTRPSIAVRRISRDEGDLYASTAAEGWREFGYADFMLEMGRVFVHAEGVHLFVADIDGRSIAAGAVAIHDGVAHLAGASTVPDARGRGAQNALLDARLRFARAQGCDLAVMGALPGSASQRNAERNGFHIAYTRIKWHKK